MRSRISVDNEKGVTTMQSRAGLLDSKGTKQVGTVTSGER